MATLAGRFFECARLDASRIVQTVFCLWLISAAGSHCPGVIDEGTDDERQRPNCGGSGCVPDDESSDERGVVKT
jgi:hypothetical protein